MSEDIMWIRKLAAWQGGVDATIKGLAKNQNEIERRLQTIWDSHTNCREQMLITLATLQADAKNEGKRWGIIMGIISSLFVAIIITIVNNVLS